MPVPTRLETQPTRSHGGCRMKLGIPATLVLALIVGACVPSQPTRQDAMGDIFGLLGEQGFTANAGLSRI